MKEYELSVNKELRDTYMERLDVLDKVKKLFLIPGMEVMTTKQVAEYFEVDVDVIKKVYERNRNEIDSDGTVVKTISDFRVGQDVTNASELKGQDVTNVSELKGQDVTNVSNCTFKIEERKQGSVILRNEGGMCIEVANRGIRCFSQRAILRIAMLLRDSAVAKEVRTQLLNTFENTDAEDRILSIDEEQTLWTEFGKAMMSGNVKDALQAMADIQTYHNRHIDALVKENDELTRINKLLSDDINTWDNKAMLNAMVRSAAVNCFGGNFGKAWGSYYKQLQYKSGINLTSRNGTGSKIDRIKEEEWVGALRMAAAWLIGMNVDVVAVINSVNASAVNQ